MDVWGDSGWKGTGPKVRKAWLYWVFWAIAAVLVLGLLLRVH